MTPHPDATTQPPQTQRQAWEDGGTPDVEQVRPGLWAVPVPIPHNPLRYTLSYALEHEHGLAVVDPGWNAPLSWQTLCAGLEATGHAVESVTAVLATHVHPDHYGLADQLRRHSGAWVGLHPADAALLDTDDDVPRLATATRAMFTMTGAPDLHLDPDDYERALRHFVPAGTPDRLLRDRELIDLGPWQLEVRHTPGHTPGHICLLDARQRILLTGDHILRPASRHSLSSSPRCTCCGPSPTTSTTSYPPTNTGSPTSTVASPRSSSIMSIACAKPCTRCTPPPPPRGTLRSV